MSNQNQNSVDVLLADSFKYLAKTKAIEKITIKEITDRAGVIRPTFYNHFQDKYELLEWIVTNELFIPAEPIFSAGMLREGVTFVLTTMQREKDFYKKCIQLEGQNSFNEIFIKCVSAAVLKYINREGIISAKQYKWLTPQQVADFYASSISYVIVKWVSDGMIVPIDELSDVYVKAFQGSIEELLRSWK